MYSDIIKFSSSIPEGAQVILDCYHEGYMVFLSYILAVLSARTALSMIERVVSVSQLSTRILWNSLGGVSLGGGIWAMHFTAMEAFRAPIPIEYNISFTVISLLIAMLFSAVALWVYSVKQTHSNTLFSGTVLGTGIVFMHYIGMAAMVMPATIYYDVFYFIASILIAIGASLAALYIAQLFLKGWIPHPILMRTVCSCVMGGAITGMHFSSMAGTVLVQGSQNPLLGPTVSSSSQLIWIVAFISILILIFSVIVGDFHRRWQLNQQHLEEVKSLVKELKFAKQSMHHLAYMDPITDLENRHSLDEALTEIISQDEMQNEKFTLLFMDIDNFKRVNDRFGHALGDKLLKSVAKRLKMTLRPSDKIARFGGDEFVVILTEDNEFDIGAVAKRVQKSMSRPFILQNKDVSLTLSVGIACYPEHGQSAADLVRNADIALYHAKELGKNRFAEFDKDMHFKLNKLMQLETDLKDAIINEEIEVYYQPIVDTQTHEIIQLEALARWTNKGEFVSPIEFIPIAEERDLIIPLGNLMFKRVMMDIASFNEQGIKNIKVSVNLSPIQFGDRLLVDNVESMLKQYAVLAEQLEVEITENSLIKNIDVSVEQLNKLKALGTSISIDDFGTGYSSLSYLKKLPIDKIKIDRTFVSSLPDDKDDVAINEAVLAMSHRLNLLVVAEGIETKEQAAFYLDRQCALLQGYLFSRPLPKNEIEILLKQGVLSIDLA